MTQQPVNVTSTSSSGIGFTGALFLVFLVLKLTGVINWSWWWVTAPLWGGAALFLVIAIIALLAALFITGVEAAKKPRKRL